MIFLEMRFKYNEVIILSGPSSTGKSHFCKTYFSPSQVLSSDAFRIMVSDDEVCSFKPNESLVTFDDQDKKRFDLLENAAFRTVSEDAFHLLNHALEIRAKHNRFTVVDATTLWAEDIEQYVEICHKYHVPCSVIFFEADLSQTLHFNSLRPYPRGANKIKHQFQLFKKLTQNKKRLGQSGIRSMYHMLPTEDHNVVIEQTNLTIPIGNGLDVLGDGHGLLESRVNIIEKGGYIKGSDGLFRHPDGRKLVYLNDETSRGKLPMDGVKFGKYPSIAMAVMMMEHVKAGLAYAVDSNHNFKIWRWLEGKNVTMAHGDEDVVSEFESFELEHGPEFTFELKKQLAHFLRQLPAHLIIEDRGIWRAVVTHAGIQDQMIGKQSKIINDYCRFGPTDGFCEDGRPNRLDWTKSHRNGMLVIWGHEPHDKVVVHNDAVNVDTGGFCGHYLSMFRYPEMQVVQEKVNQCFVDESNNPILRRLANRFSPLSLQSFIHGFDVETPLGKFHANSRNVQSVLELTSTKTAPIEEIVYIPPTMSPTPTTSDLPDYLEHPMDAFDYYKNHGIQRVICEKKHMGSRAVLCLFKDREAGVEYFGKPTLGSILSRNGVRFFTKENEENLLQRLCFELAPYFEQHRTKFILIDAEVMPWNLKASGLIDKQYALTAHAAIADRTTRLKALEEFAENHSTDISEEIQIAKQKLDNANSFQKAYEFYCWSADSQTMSGVQIAPFHILAFSNESHFDKDHVWHMEQSKYLSELSTLFVTTEHCIVTLEDDKQIKDATTWWEDMTSNGHEGMVVKPLDFITKNDKGQVLQPAIKVRGREYLRIIYGMDYLEPHNLKVLKKRSVKGKMKNALKEFHLSIESVRRFMEKDSLERIHECVLASLSYENDEIDPRL